MRGAFEALDGYTGESLGITYTIAAAVTAAPVACFGCIKGIVCGCFSAFSGVRTPQKWFLARFFGHLSAVCQGAAQSPNGGLIDSISLALGWETNTITENTQLTIIFFSLSEASGQLWRQQQQKPPRSLETRRGLYGNPPGISLRNTTPILDS